MKTKKQKITITTWSGEVKVFTMTQQEINKAFEVGDPIFQNVKSFQSHQA